MTKSGDRIPVECRVSIVRTETGEIEKIVVSERPVKEERVFFQIQNGLNGSK